MKKPKFFCDNCGAEVARNLRSCPGCGRFFSSVRCPKCGFSGEDKLFMSGCPSCGYSAPVRGQLFKLQPAAPEKRFFPAGPLPLWVYILVILAFVAAITALGSVLLF